MTAAMDLTTLLFIAGVFVLAGLVKGVIGLGLQVVPMGLLALIMPTVEAAALLVVPALATNAWQMLAGHGLPALVRRLWPTMAGLCVGTWLGAGLMTGDSAVETRAMLALALIAYAALGLSAVRLVVAPRFETWAGPVAGAVTGVITAATGVFVIPVVPYLAALGLDKDDLVQALGLTFMVATLALAVNLFQAGALGLAVAGPSSLALGCAMVGMVIGQGVRSRLDAGTFRLCFFVGLLVLGMHLLARSLG